MICKKCFVILVIGLTSLAALVWAGLIEEAECNQIGGVYVRGVVGYHCIDAKELK